MTRSWSSGVSRLKWLWLETCWLICINTSWSLLYFWSWTLCITSSGYGYTYLPWVPRSGTLDWLHVFANAKNGFEVGESGSWHHQNPVSDFVVLLVLDSPVNLVKQVGLIVSTTKWIETQERTAYVLRSYIITSCKSHGWFPGKFVHKKFYSRTICPTSCNELFQASSERRSRL